MELELAIRGRRAVRQFTADGVDDAAILELIDAAIQAPSAVNEQPWSFYVCRRREHLQQINLGAKAHLLRTTAGAAAVGSFQQMLADPATDIFHGAPALIVIASHVDSMWSTEDCALAAQNLMLTAYALGLGTCWIGSVRDFLRTAEGRSLLDLAPQHVAVAPIIFGHPRSIPQAGSRKPADIHWVS